MGTATPGVVIIGGGPGGYVAAIRAAQLGLNPVLVEKTRLGGICLNWGCIPTKTLLKSAELYHHMVHAKDFGITVEGATPHLSEMVARSRQIAEQLSKGVQHLMKKNGVTVLAGHGQLEGRQDGMHHIKVIPEASPHKPQMLQAPAVILATGARPRVVKGLEPDGTLIWTSREALSATTLPPTLLVVGSGAIGLEFASFYTMLGTQVHLVEMQDEIFPPGDPEIRTAIQRAFEKMGMSLYTQTTVDTLSKQGDRVEVTLKTPSGPQKLSVDKILVAAGITGNVEDLGLEATAVQVERGQIVTQGFCATHEPGIFAIGDVTGSPWLAHKASHEAVLCVEHLAGIPGGSPLDPLRIPGCVYSFPQIACLGLTEPQALEKGYEISVGRFPFMANGKALAMGQGEGVVKLIFERKTGELLGAHLVGPDVTELIGTLALAQAAEATEETLAHTIFPHPTLSETLHEAVLNALGRGLHF
jgi:dihydrolipoamide dehydrogenase